MPLKLLICSVLVITSYFQTFSQWEKVSSLEEKVNKFYQSNNGQIWAIGEKGLILSSDTSLISWQEHNLEVEVSFNDVVFHDSIGFLLGDEGILLKTSDYGVSWTELDVDTNFDLTSISFVSLDQIYIGVQETTSRGELLKSEDGGLSWNKVSIGNDSDVESFPGIFDVHFADTNTGFLISLRSIAKTSDGGENWNYIISSGPKFSKILANGDSIYFPIVDEYPNYVIYTHDLGESLSNITPPTNIQSFALLDGDILGFTQNEYYQSNSDFSGWSTHSRVLNHVNSIESSLAIGEEKLIAFSPDTYGSIVVSEDGGQTWRASLTLEVGSIEKLDFPVPNVGYGIDQDGLIFKSIDNGNLWKIIHDVNYNNAISFYDEMNGLIVGQKNNDSYVLRTSDGGDTWEDFFVSDVQLCNEVIHLTRDTILIAQSSEITNGVYRSVNGGETWMPISSVREAIDIDAANKKVYALNNNPSSNRLELAVSLDSGKVWQKNSGGPTEIQSIEVIDGRDLIYVARGFGSGSVYVTENDGKLWDRVYSQPIPVNDMTEIPKGLVAIADQQTILSGAINGKWTSESLEYDGSFTDIQTNSANHVFIAGSGGLLRNRNPHIEQAPEVAFERDESPILGLTSGGAVFFDADQNETQDLLITGLNNSEYYSKLYFNDGNGNFQEVEDVPFPGVCCTAPSVGDIDGDGDKDLFIFGSDTAGIRITKSYLNDGNGNFSEIENAVDSLKWGMIEMFQIDENESIDLLVIGENTGSEKVAKVYLNDGTGNFTLHDNLTIENVSFVNISSGDIDGDQTNDIVLSGANSKGTFVYLNDGNGNFSLNASHDEVSDSTLDLVDINADNFLDLVTTGVDRTGSGLSTQFFPVLSVFINDGLGNFVKDERSSIVNVRSGSADFADIDGNGTLDFYVSGLDEFSERTAAIYLNDGTGLFIKYHGLGLEPIWNGSANFANIDGNLSPDLLTVGLTDGSVQSAILYRNLSSQNTPPIIEDQQFSIAENSEEETQVGMVIAADPENDELIFSIITEGITAFGLDSFSGELKVLNSALLDFEQTNSFDFFVSVSDGSDSTLAEIVITLENVNESPEMNDQSFSVDENSHLEMVIGTVEVYDPENDNLTYSVTSGNESGLFVLDDELLRISGAIDFESTEVHTLAVNVSDGALDTNATITIIVNDVNESPEVPNQNTSVNENRVVGSSIGTILFSDPENDMLTLSIIDGNEAGKFEIENDGTVKIAEMLDFETVSEYVLTIEAFDGEFKSSGDLTIHIIDVNESPLISDQIFTINENSPSGAVVGTVEASDPENDELIFSIIEGNENNVFSFLDQGQLSVLDSASLDFELSTSFNLTVQVADGEFTASALITVEVQDVDDTAPVITSSLNIDVMENNSGVIYAVTADEGASFSLGNTKDESLFMINENEISFSSSPDFESPADSNADNIYLIDIVAEDESGNSSISELKITVLDEDEPLSISTSNSSLIYPNPVSDQLTVNVIDFHQVIIYDMAGKKVLKSKLNILDVSNLKNGTYLVEVHGGEGVKVNVVIKN